MNKPFLIGLTGSVGMGKSTTAQMFADLGVPVWDADSAVHRLYSVGGAAVPLIKSAFPGAVFENEVRRDRLKALIQANGTVLKKIETLVHPLVARDRSDFIHRCTGDLVLLDIPLLFETGAGADMDVVVVVTAPADVQRDRVLSRPNMSEDDFDLIVSKQLPDAQKRVRADYVVETSSLDTARQAVQDILADIRAKIANA